MKYNKKTEFNLLIVIREMTNDTLIAFCHRTGVEVSTLRNVVNRENCNLDTAKSIADGLEISLGTFYSIITENQQEKVARKEGLDTMRPAKYTLTKKIREISGTTVAQWCENNNIPTRTVETMIVAKGCSLATARRFADALGITLDEFYDILVYGKDTTSSNEENGK